MGANEARWDFFVEEDRGKGLKRLEELPSSGSGLLPRFDITLIPLIPLCFPLILPCSTLGDKFAKDALL